MNPCADLEGYLSRQLAGSRARGFEKHLSACLPCRMEVAEWKKTCSSFSEWYLAEEGNTEPTPTPNDAAHFARGVWSSMAAKERARQKKRVLPRFVLVGATVCLLLVLGVAIFSLVRDRVESQSPEQETRALEVAIFFQDGTRSHKKEILVRDHLDAPENARVLAWSGGDKIGLSPGTRVNFVSRSRKKTRLRLKEGTVACSVQKRTPAAEFIVEANDVLVTVIGTRFSVTRTEGNDVLVSVSSGRVHVGEQDSAGTYVLEGESVRVVAEVTPEPMVADSKQIEEIEYLLSQQEEWPDDADAVVQKDAEGKEPIVDTPQFLEPAGSPDTEPDKETDLKPDKKPEKQPPASRTVRQVNPLDQWRIWMTQGRLRDAEQEISNYLGRNPSDYEAWMLLAAVQRKEGRFSDAVGSYENAAKHGGVNRARRARYLAAVILQEKLNKHGQAISLLEQYLSNSQEGTPTYAEAKLRMARSLIAMGKKMRAAELLRDIALNYGRMPVAMRARKLLKKIETGK